MVVDMHVRLASIGLISLQLSRAIARSYGVQQSGTRSHTGLHVARAERDSESENLRCATSPSSRHDLRPLATTTCQCVSAGARIRE